MTNIVFALTQGRHKIINPQTGEEVKQSIYGTELSMNISGLEDFASEFIKNNGTDETTYEVFVTGFTPALTSFIKALYNFGGGWCNNHLILWHYDSNADTYRKQIMF